MSISHLAACTVLLLAACGESTPTAVPPPEIVLRGITVVAESPMHMWVAESRRVIAMGQTDGGDVFLPSGVTWESTHPDIASIDTTGLLQAHGAGSTLVTARYRNFSRTVHLTVSPVLVGIRLTPQSSLTTDSTLVFDFEAVFLDVNDQEFSVPGPIEWHVVQGLDTLPIQVLGTPPGSRIRVQVRKTDDFTVTMHSSGYTVTRKYESFVEQAPFTVARFEIVQKAAGTGWLYMPDLQLRSEVDDLVITRLEFRTAAPVRHACGKARLNVAADPTPLFDFQPYNFAWQGVPVAAGTPAQVTITAEHAGRVFQVTVTGIYTVTQPGTVLDYGTTGFEWRHCA
ncbi:MAG: hypothetical protein V4813_04495 [Gemmatimonadota bacterium]